MKSCILTPSPLCGTVTPPPSKSLAHRALICAGLADGVSELCNIEISEDIEATIGAMSALGCQITHTGRRLTVYGIGGRSVGQILNLEHMAIQNKTETQFSAVKEIAIDCKESGSTLRFFLPVVLAVGGSYRFTGRGKLGERPLEPYFKIFREHGIFYEQKKGLLDLSVRGKLKSGTFHIDGNISSQFISGLLFAAPLMGGDCEIVVGKGLESKGYVDLTLSALAEFGVKAENRDYKSFFIKGGQKYASCRYTVEADYSQAAFFFAAGALGNRVGVTGISDYSLQGDRAVKGILESLGYIITQDSTKNNSSLPDGAQPEIIFNAKKTNASSGRITVVDASEFPDIMPPVALAAALMPGITEIVNASRLRMKECDRLSAIVSELNAIGADITEFEDKMVIRGVKKLRGGVFDAHNDHRMAMTAAVAASVCENPVTLLWCESVKKSYPGFWEDYRMLGGKMKLLD